MDELVVSLPQICHVLDVGKEVLPFRPSYRPSNILTATADLRYYPPWNNTMRLLKTWSCWSFPWPETPVVVVVLGVNADGVFSPVPVPVYVLIYYDTILESFLHSNIA